MGIRKMLVPVVLEERDENVLKYVCGLDTQGVRELLIVTVVDSSGVEAPILVRDVERARERLLEMASSLETCGMSYEVRVVTGNATYDALMSLAHQVDVDVICCGTEGKSFVDYLFSGSLSESFSHLGDKRTMTVRYDLLESVEDPAQIAHDFARRLVVPTDFSASATRAALSAFEREPGALGTVYLVHVVPAPQSFTEASPTPEEWVAKKRAQAEVQLEALVEMAQDHDVDAVAVILDGDAVEQVYKYVCDIDATGVITGRRGRGRFGREVLGSVSMKLLRDAPCPVVIQP